MRRKESNNMEKAPGIFRDQILTVGDLEDFRARLLEQIKNLLQEVNGQPSKQWLKSTEVRKMLGISPGTLQNLRVNGTLSYTKIGGIVFYRYDEIAKLLNSQNTK
jgi:hypothetical protein